MNLISKLKNAIKKKETAILLSSSAKCTDKNVDRVKLYIAGLNIELEREITFDTPHEVSIIVPRAEIRQTFPTGEKPPGLEIVLSSITIVHAPRHPLAGEKPSGPEIKPPPI